MKYSASSLAVATACMVVLFSSCRSGKVDAVNEGAPASAQPKEPSRSSADEAGEAATESRPHVDQVPGALERMRPWQGLGEAVTTVVMNSPQGRIHGHDAARIEIDVSDAEDTARIRFVMLPGFELHGDRTVSCVRSSGAWSCHDDT
jgi:hypothetical protein